MLFIPQSCGSVVEHCICSAKGCGFDSQGTHIMKKNVLLQNITNKSTYSLSQFCYEDKNKENCCHFIPVCSLFLSREQTFWLWSEKLQIITHSLRLFHSLISSLLSRYEFLVAVFRQNPGFSTDLHALTFLQHFVGINGLLHALHVSLHFQPH